MLPQEADERFFQRRSSKRGACRSRLLSLFRVDDHGCVGVVSDFFFDLADGADLEDVRGVDVEGGGETSVDYEEGVLCFVEVEAVFLVVIFEGEDAVFKAGECA